MKNFLKKFSKKQDKIANNSKEAAKERLHLVLMQDRANVSADFLELMKQEIIEVIKKYIDVDEKEIDVRLTNKENADGTNGAPALYANIPILNIKNESRKVELKDKNELNKEQKEIKTEELKKEENAEKQQVKKELKEENNNQLNKNEKHKNIIKPKNENLDKKIENKKEDKRQVSNNQKENKQVEQVKIQTTKEKAKSEN